MVQRSNDTCNNGIDSNESVQTDIRTLEISSIPDTNIHPSFRGEVVQSNAEQHVRKHPDYTAQHRCAPVFWQTGAVVSCFFANFVSSGVAGCYGVLYTYMQEPLGASEYQLSWIGALMSGFIGFTSLVATILIDSKGCRLTTFLGPVLSASGFIIGSQTSNIYVLYFTLGVLPGMGFCLSYNASMVSVNQQFTKWRPVAVGIAVSGGGAGLLVLPPLTSTIADNMGWRGAVLISGSLLLHQVPCALWTRPTFKSGKKFVDTNSNGKSPILQTILNYLQMFKFQGTIPTCMTYLFIGLCCNTFWIFTPAYLLATEPGRTATDAALVISFVGFGSLAGRIVFAGASLVHTQAPEIILVTALVSCGLSNIIVPLTEHWLGFLFDGAFHGLAFGAFATVSSLVMVNLFGLQNLSKTFGTLTFLQGMGAISGPPLQSYIGTSTNNQDLIFYCGGGFYVLSSFCLLAALIRRKAIPRRKESLVVNVVGTKNDGFIADDPV